MDAEKTKQVLKGLDPRTLGDELPKGKKWRIIWLIVAVAILCVIVAIAF